MRSRPDAIFSPAPPSGGVCSTSGRKADPVRAEADVDLGCEVTIEVCPDRPQPVVSVVGLLGHSGGALLAAVLQYVRARDGGPVAVDLRGVSHADPSSLAAVIESGAVLAGSSPAVDQALAGFPSPWTSVKSRGRIAATGRMSSSGKPDTDSRLPRPYRGPPVELSWVHDS
jgi:hypothetical protein